MLSIIPITHQFEIEFGDAVDSGRSHDAKIRSVHGGCGRSKCSNRAWGKDSEIVVFGNFQSIFKTY
jgi:hypothetical protein